VRPLVTYGKNGKIEPGLATSWEASEDGKHYLFHLKKTFIVIDFNLSNVSIGSVVSVAFARSIENLTADASKSDPSLNFHLGKLQKTVNTTYFI
jgi:ABC-type oligopeptide transport system substrate-binding subunit